MKSVLTSDTVLQAMDINKDVFIVSVASQDGFSFCSMQRDDQGVLRPIAFGVQALTRAQKSYQLVDLELTAAALAIRNYDYWLIHRKIYLLLFSKVNQATLKCDNGQTADDVKSNETQFVITLPCGCVLMAREIFIPASSIHCVQVANLSLDLELQYLANIPYINSFFKEDMLSVVRNYSYLNHTIAAILPALQIASKEYEVTVSLEKTAKFKMDAIVNKTKEDIDSYTSLSHYLYNVLLKTHTHERTFDWFNAFDILLLLASIAGLLALGLSVIMHFRLRSVMLLLAKSSRALAQEAPGLITFPQAKAAVPTVQSTFEHLYFHKTIKELVPIDLSMMFFIIFMILILVGHLFYNT